MSAPAPLAHPNPGGQRPFDRIGRTLDALATYWRRYPDMRLAQILGNFTPGGTDAYFVEDAFIEHRLRVAIADALAEAPIEAADLTGRHVGLELLVADPTGTAAPRWESIDGVVHHNSLVGIHVDNEQGESEAVYLRPDEIVTLRIPAVKAPAA